MINRLSPKVIFLTIGLFLCFNLLASNQPIDPNNLISKETKEKVKKYFTGVCSCSGQINIGGYTMYINIAYELPSGYGSDCSQPSWCLPGVNQQYITAWIPIDGGADFNYESSTVTAYAYQTICGACYFSRINLKNN